MKYALAVEVKLVEMCDDEPIEPPAGGDPLRGAVSLMTGAIGRIGNPMQYAPPTGFDFRKQITVGVHNFAGIAAIISRFDELVTDIEHEKMQV
jgi:hypothetical protein